MRSVQRGCGVSPSVSVIADLCARLELHYPLVKLHWSYVWAGARKDVFVVVVLWENRSVILRDEYRIE